MSTRNLTRREFLRIASITGVGLVAAACAPSAPTVAPTSAPTNTAAAATSAPKATAAPSPTSGPRSGGILRVGSTTDGLSLGYPPKQTRTFQLQAEPAIEALVRFDKSAKPAPYLATAFTGDQAAKTITLTLRKGVKFHDGTDFNADAVKSNLDQYALDKSQGTEKFKSVDVVDDYTVRINLTSWDSTAISALAGPTGMMISPTAFKKNGADWAANNPVGTGPFQFVSWQKDSKTTYKKFPGYWQPGKPYLDGIEYIPIPDTMTRMLSFRKGEVDLVLGMAPKDLQDLEKEGFVVSRVRQGSGAWGVIPDSTTQGSPWANVKVRQAAQYSFDDESLVKTVYLGEGEAANQYGYKGHWGYNPNVVGYPYDPSKAKQLLAEAGFPNGFKTQLTYITSSTGDQYMTAVQGFLKAVGIDVTLVPITQQKWTDQALNGGKWEGLMWAGPQPSPDVAAALVARLSGGKSYSMMLTPDDYLKAIQDAVTAPDFDAEQKAVWEVMRLMIDKYALYLPTYAGTDSAVSAAVIRDHGFNATPDTATWAPENAWISQAR